MQFSRKNLTYGGNKSNDFFDNQITKLFILKLKYLLTGKNVDLAEFGGGSCDRSDPAGYVPGGGSGGGRNGRTPQTWRINDIGLPSYDCFFLHVSLCSQVMHCIFSEPKILVLKADVGRPTVISDLKFNWLQKAWCNASLDAQTSFGLVTVSLNK